MLPVIRFTKLEACLEEIKKAHPRAEDRDIKFKEHNLQRLISKLNSLNGNELADYAEQLSPEGLYFIVDIMHLDAVEHLLAKIVFILRRRYRMGFPAKFWYQLNHHPANQSLAVAIMSATEGKSWGSAIKPTTAETVGKALYGSDFLQEMTSLILSRNSEITETLHDLEIIRHSELERQVLLAILLHGDRRQLLRQGSNQLSMLLEHLESSKWEQAFINYLSRLRLEEWEDPFLSSIEIDLIAHVNRYHAVLTKLTEAKAQALKHRLVHRSLIDAFGEHDPRMSFWKQFANDIILPISVIKLRGSGSPKAYGLDFENFGVIEFSEKGAAYFYHPEDFKRNLRRVDPRDDDLKQYKDVYGYFFNNGDNRLIHSGSWQANWTHTIRRLIQVGKK